MSNLKDFCTNKPKTPVVFFDLFDTLVKVDRGLLEPYFDRETDRKGDLGLLKDAKETINVLISNNPTMEKTLGMTQNQMENYYKDVMKASLINPPMQVIEMLKKLKENGCRTCVISDACFVDIAEWTNSPLAQFFDDTVFSCEVGIVKPDPRLFLLAQKRMGDPHISVFVGDGGHDELMGAQQTNMKTVKAEWINNRRLESIYQYSDYKVQEAQLIPDIVDEIQIKINEKTNNLNTNDIEIR